MTGSASVNPPLRWKRDRISFPHQPEQKMLGPEVVVVESLRFVLGELQHFAGAFSELVEWVEWGHVGDTLPKCFSGAM